MNVTILECMNRLVGQPCCLQLVGKNRSLNLGFGEVVRHSSTIAEAIHGEWEIGTYYCSWRIIQNNTIVCASSDTVDDIEEIRQKIREINWGRFSSIRHLSDFDLRVELDNGVLVDFLATISDEDEILHVFMPEKIALDFTIATGWVLGPSDQSRSPGY